jgi:hypothetical protein
MMKRRDESAAGRCQGKIQAGGKGPLGKYVHPGRKR